MHKYELSPPGIDKVKCLKEIKELLEVYSGRVKNKNCFHDSEDEAVPSTPDFYNKMLDTIQRIVIEFHPIKRLLDFDTKGDIYCSNIIYSKCFE